MFFAVITLCWCVCLLFVANMGLWSRPLWTIFISMFMLVFFVLWPSLGMIKETTNQFPKVCLLADQIQNPKRKTIFQDKNVINHNQSYLVGTHSGLQHGLVKSYASRLTLSPLFCLSRWPKHGLHERLWQWLRDFDVQCASFWFSWFSTFSCDAFSSSRDMLFVL